jgi:hypothetical protein
LIFFESGSAKQQTTAGIAVSVTTFGICGCFSQAGDGWASKKQRVVLLFFLLFLQFRNNFRGSNPADDRISAIISQCLRFLSIR